jgi:hypothetical protein
MFKMIKFVTYKKFQDADQANELVVILNQNQIPFEIEDNSRNVSDFIIGQDIDSKIIVKIHPDNFTKVNQLLNDNASLLVNEVDKNYYLVSFDNDELMEVLSEPDKWCELDKQLSKKILSDRGIIVTKELEDTLYQKRIKELSVKEKGSILWTTVGYISAFLGGLLGIAIGLNLWTSKRTLPNGKRIYTYTEKDRHHGQTITIIGIVTLCVAIYLQIKFHYF